MTQVAPTYGMEHYEQVEGQFEAVDDNVHGIVGGRPKRVCAGDAVYWEAKVRADPMELTAKLTESLVTVEFARQFAM